jgi:hypothetical protein
MEEFVNPWKRGNRSATANVDEDFVGFEDFVVDHDGVGRLKASMALDDRTILESPQPFFYAPVRPSGDFILACPDTLHIDAHIAIDDKSKLSASTSNVACMRAGNERLCRNTPCVYACATKFAAFNNRDRLTRGRKACRQRWTSLPCPDDDCIKMPRHEAPPVEKIAGHLWPAHRSIARQSSCRQ